MRAVSHGLQKKRGDWVTHLVFAGYIVWFGFIPWIGYDCLQPTKDV
jgi:hypothetical protein